MTRKVRLFAVGISQYSGTSFSDLPSAINDSELLYDAFSAILGNEFDYCHSILSANITAHNFKAILTSILGQTINDDSIFILYYSGHATIEQQTLTLHFIDSKDSKYGTISTYEIDEILRRFNRPETLIIFDCCYSGLAGNLSRSLNLFHPVKTTVISSSKYFEASRYDGDYSVFTKALVDSVFYLDESGEQISVGKIQGQIESYFDKRSLQHPAFYLPEDKTDVILKASPKSTERDAKYFVKEFLNTLFISNAGVRETLWYSLNEMPEYVILDVFQQIKQNEPSWLVRRAMGSTLSSVSKLFSRKKKVCIELLNSTQWMDNCVGVIGARYNVNDIDIKQAFIKLIQNDKPMDVKWLAFLYLADTYNLPLFEIIDLSVSGLMNSEWGVCEIWERCINSSSEDIQKKVEATKYLLNFCKSKKLKNALVTHIALLNEEMFNHLTQKYKRNITRNILNDEILLKYTRVNQRGMIKVSGTYKWLYSKVYGEWRGQVQNPLVSIFKDLNKVKVHKLLCKCQKIPSVSIRMSIFQNMQLYPDLLDRYLIVLRWGFKDQHPWVRRAATECLMHCPKLKENKKHNLSLLKDAAYSSDPFLYPGTLELAIIIIKVAKYWGVEDDVINQILKHISEGFGPSDKSAIEWVLKNEFIRFKFC